LRARADPGRGVAAGPLGRRRGPAGATERRTTKRRPTRWVGRLLARRGGAAATCRFAEKRTPVFLTRQAPAKRGLATRSPYRAAARRAPLGPVDGPLTAW